MFFIRVCKFAVVVILGGQGFGNSYGGGQRFGDY